MNTNKWLTVALWVISSVAYAGDNQENSSEGKESRAEETKSDQPEPTSTFDRVMEIIAEAAISDRNFGKDIGDR